MEQQELDLVNQSYNRCLENKDFFPHFYKNFTSKSPDIAERFKNTDMKRQMDALRLGLQYMIMFASGSKIAAAKVEDLGLTHDRHHRNITPELYEAWLQSLIETIKSCDPNYSDEIAMAWRNTLGFGIRQMKSMY